VRIWPPENEDGRIKPEINPTHKLQLENKKKKKKKKKKQQQQQQQKKKLNEKKKERKYVPCKCPDICRSIGHFAKCFAVRGLWLKTTL
jgi:hypothetical protein